MWVQNKHYSKQSERGSYNFFGYVVKKHELEDLALTGKIEGKRTKERQRLTFISTLSRWMRTRKTDIIKAAKERTLWKSMAANVLLEQGT